MVLYAAYQDPRPSEWLSRNAGIAGGEAAVHRRRQRRRQGPVRPVRRHGRAPARGRRDAMNWSALDWGILGPALIAGLLVLATHVPLGTQVLDRGIVFIDLAIAQIAGLGVIAADALGLPEAGVAVQAAAVSRGAARRAAADVDRAARPAAAGGADRRAVHPRGLRRHPAAGRQPARRRAPEGSAGRADPVGQRHPAAVARGGHCAAARRAVARLGAAARPLRLLRRLCARRHRIGAAGRRVPRVLEPDHSGARHAALRGPRRCGHRLWRSGQSAMRSGSRCRRCSTCRRAR